MVWDRSRVVVALRTARGSEMGATVEASWDEVDDDGLSEDWKCVMRVRVVFVRSTRAFRARASCAGALLLGGMMMVRIEEIQDKLASRIAQGRKIGCVGIRPNIVSTLLR